MFRAQLIGQTKVSQRGYIEVRTTVWNLPMMMVILGLFIARARRAWWGSQGLVLEFLEFMGKVFDYKYEPRHVPVERVGAHRAPKVRKVREVAWVFGMEVGKGTRRLVV